MKKVLVLSPYFPPYGGGGIIRVHNFVKYLPENGYNPVVLALKPQYYENLYSIKDLEREYNDSVKVFRTPGLEPVAKEIKEKACGVKEKSYRDKILLSILKKVANTFLIPDRMILWSPYAIKRGIEIIREENIELIFSTSPPFSTHLLARALSKLSGLRYLVDYRDDWVGNSYFGTSYNAVRRSMEKWMEHVILKGASGVVTVTEESSELFRRKYPDLDIGKIRLIPNGFDPDYFLSRSGDSDVSRNGGRINFVHTGSLTSKRDPIYFLTALRDLLREEPDYANRIKISFLGFVHHKHQEMIKEIGLNGSYYQRHNLAPEEVASFLKNEADVCLVFQRRSEGGSTAIPGKVYEYLASRKPILCMDDNGATTKLLSNIGSNLNVAYDDVKSIKVQLKTIIEDYDRIAERFDWGTPLLKRYNRRAHAGQLAKFFNEVLGVKNYVDDNIPVNV
ncbi:MAG: glycosyltransferase [candidate division Zixibacteria bacterium]|nr:glycosyltransferase [candidate division Zixibacteria bacterium]